MKKFKGIGIALCLSVSTIVLLTMSGCAEYLKFSNTLPGQYNLQGVSKIALVGFNSLPSDPVLGVYSVDDDTKKIVEDMVATVFFKGKTYKVANLDVEKLIYSSKKAGAIALAQRFDAILYGRVWWKKSDEKKSIHPVVHTLEKWKKVQYQTRDSRGNRITKVKNVTISMTDVMREHKYRASNATLMFSVTLYKLSKDGQVTKIVEDFAVADQKYLLDNGAFLTAYNPHDVAKLSKIELIKAQSEDKDAKAKKEANEKAGYINDDQNSRTIPTDLQTKIMLGQKLSQSLSSKMTPTEIEVEVERDFSIDDKLVEAMRKGNFEPVRKTLTEYIIKEVTPAVAEKIGFVIETKIDKQPSFLKKLDAAKEKLTDTEGKLEETKDTLADAEDKLEEDKKALEKENQSKKKIKDKKALEELEKKIAGYKKSINNLEDKIDDTKDKIKDIQKDIADLKEDIADYEEELNEIVEDYEDELYALAISEEACRKYEEALNKYRSLLKAVPEKKYALGISRCLTSLDMAKELKKAAKNVKAAIKKAKVK